MNIYIIFLDYCIILNKEQINSIKSVLFFKYNFFFFYRKLYVLFSLKVFDKMLSDNKLYERHFCLSKAGGEKPLAYFFYISLFHYHKNLRDMARISALIKH